MTKGNAKSTFCLSEKDLAGLPVIHKKNPHYSSAAPMCLYTLLDLKAACLNKYGSPKGLADKSAKNLSAAQKRRATLAAKPPPPPRQKRYREYEGEDWGNDIVCSGCGNTGAVDCITESCCHCCKNSGAFRCGGGGGGSLGGRGICPACIYVLSNLPLVEGNRPGLAARPE